MTEPRRHTATRIVMTIGWAVLLLFPFIGFWSFFRPFFNDAVPRRFKWTYAGLFLGAWASFIVALANVRLFSTFVGLTYLIVLAAFCVWMYMVWITTAEDVE